MRQRARELTPAAAALPFRGTVVLCGPIQIHLRDVLQEAGDLTCGLRLLRQDEDRRRRTHRKVEEARVRSVTHSLHSRNFTPLTNCKGWRERERASLSGKSTGPNCNNRIVAQF